jgi:cytochrome c oxidase cbb3-type subunit 3
MEKRLQNLTESLGVVLLLHALAAPAAAQPRPPSAAQIETGQRLFSAQCGFCHGRDAMGGETGPDLTRSSLVRDDVGGDKLEPVIREGRGDRMPGFRLAPPELAAVIAFIKSQKTKSELPGARRSVDVADLQSGNADAGRKYFEGAGRCATCHSPSGDFAGLAGRLKGLELLQRMLYPSKSRAATVAVTAAGETVRGSLAYRDEFTIALTDESGRYRSWPTNLVTFTVTNPLDAHVEQLGKYSDADMHNVLAYLQTLLR